MTWSRKVVYPCSPLRMTSPKRTRAETRAVTKVGCCGFPVARPKYSSTLSLVEVQQTFYHPPMPQTAKRWREQAGSDFEFTLKAWQLITHQPSSPTYRRLKTVLSGRQKRQVGNFRWTDVVRRAWDTTLQIARLLDTDKIVFQCPASLQPTAENTDNMHKFFGSIERTGLTCIWEPRGKWQRNQIARLCRELKLVHCVDPFKDKCITKGLQYHRLHGISGYRHKYTDQELTELVGRCQRDKTTYLLFNNVSMWEDALRFRKLLEQRL
jgi:uncharacterized protein YecE (DUF72 family)